MGKNTYKEAYPENSIGAARVSLDRAHSPFKILAFPDLIKRYMSGEEIHPIHIRIGITNKCNLKCNFCNYHSTNEVDFYDAFNYHDTLCTETVQELLSDFQMNGGLAVTFCGSGECTIHPGYMDICYHACDAGLKIGLITNGSMFGKQDMLRCVAKTHNWVRIGINAGTSATYSRIVHIQEKFFVDILRAVYYLREHAVQDDFIVGLNFVVTLENYREILKAAQIAKSANANYIRYEPEFYTALAHDTIYGKINEIDNLFRAVKELEDESFQISIPKFNRGPMVNTNNIEGDFSKCHYSHFATALGADGYIYPCPQIHLGKKYRMGNVILEGYKHWLRSDQREKWEKENADRRNYCKTCFYRPQNELIEWLCTGELDFGQVINEYNRENSHTLHKWFI